MVVLLRGVRTERRARAHHARRIPGARVREVQNLGASAHRVRPQELLEAWRQPRIEQHDVWANVGSNSQAAICAVRDVDHVSIAA